MKKLLAYILFFLPFFAKTQPEVHQGVFYRDDESVNSGFLSDKVDEIQNQLNYLKDNGVIVNILLMAKECPDLELTKLNNIYYYKGPAYTYNGVESSLWYIDNNQFYTFQFLPRQATIYHRISNGNSFWENTGVDFDYPLMLHGNKYYCAIKEALNSLCISKGLNPSTPTCDCTNGQPAEVESAITVLPSPYLQRNIIDIEDLKDKQITAKTNFCTNLLYYGPYLHTRSTQNELKDFLVSTIIGGYTLVTVIPDDGSNTTVFKDVWLDITKGDGYPDNCYPTMRELSEQDRLDVLHKMHGGNNSGASSDLSNVKSGSVYLLERLLSSADSPVPGITNCAYGTYGGGNSFNPGNYHYIPDPALQFYGTALTIPAGNSYVKWYNSFEGSFGDIVGSCTQAAELAQSHGLNLQFFLASGCTPNTPQFENSITEFEQTPSSGPSAAIWLYYDECDHRLYYDVKLLESFTANINAGYNITNPDSIAAARAAAEQIIEGILEEVSKMTSYENATLDESEYPANMHDEAFSSFFGAGTSCQGESPWNFGIREGYKFEVVALVTECAVIILDIFTDQTMPKRLWHPHPADSCMLDMPGAAAGIIDGCLNLVNGKVWNLTGLLSAAVDFYKADANTRKAVLHSISNPLNLILGQYPQNFQCINGAECQEERIYCFTNLITNAIFDIFGGALVGVVGRISNVGAIIDDKLKMFVPDFGDKYNIWKRTLSENAQKKANQFMENITESAKFKLAKRVTLNKIWQKFDAGELPGISKEQLQEFIERLPEHDQDAFYHHFDEIFTNEVGDIADPNKIKAFIEDVNSVYPAFFIEAFSESPEKYFRAWNLSNAAGKVHLRKNATFLNTIDDFFNGTITQKFQEYGCTLMDEAVMRHYTGDYHEDLNLALVGTLPMTDEFLEFKDAMNQALHKLPDHNGLVYRGLGDYESNLAMQWEVGKTIENANWDKKFVSTSMESDIAEDFRIKNGGTVLVKIEPCMTGKLIHAISRYKEFEVLYSTGKKYKVVSKKPREDNPSVWEIVLKEE